MTGFVPKQFIASQGPVPDAFNAFWQMVWERNVEVIAMVTNEVGFPCGFPSPLLMYTHL